MSRTCSTNFLFLSLFACLSPLFSSFIFVVAGMVRMFSTNKNESFVVFLFYYIFYLLLLLMLFRFCNVLPVCVCVICVAGAEPRAWSARVFSVALLYNFRFGGCECEFNCNVFFFCTQWTQEVYTFYEWNRIAINSVAVCVVCVCLCV